MREDEAATARREHLNGGDTRPEVLDVAGREVPAAALQRGEQDPQIFRVRCPRMLSERRSWRIAHTAHGQLDEIIEYWERSV